MVEHKEKKVNIHQAKSVIANYMQYMTVAEVYDDDAEFRTAINTLFPNFEYPDFSHKTMAVVLG